MKVVSLTRTAPIGPSSRYRVEQYRPLLAARGIEVTTRPLFGPTWFRILEMRPGLLRGLLKAGYSATRLLARLGQLLGARLSRPDLIHVEQQLFPYLPAPVEFALWPRRIPTVLEFDDAIHLTWGHRDKLAGLCARATLVIVGNRFLEAFARQTAREVRVIPTTIDPARYEAAHAHQQQRRAGSTPGPLRIGWVGLRYNLPFLEVLAGPLRRLAARQPGWELVIISSGLPEGPAWDGVPLVHRPWSPASEADEIAACDVGVMPLPDSDWARGKCALKLLQYMAAGVPVVASPVGVNVDLVRDGVNGLLAATEAGWEEALVRLATDPVLRTRLGEEGRDTVLEGYSIRGGAESVAEAYGFAAHRAEGSGESSGTAHRP